MLRPDDTLVHREQQRQVIQTHPPGGVGGAGSFGEFRDASVRSRSFPHLREEKHFDLHKTSEYGSMLTEAFDPFSSTPLPPGTVIKALASLKLDSMWDA